MSIDCTDGNLVALRQHETLVEMRDMEEQRIRAASHCRDCIHYEGAPLEYGGKPHGFCVACREWVQPQWWVDDCGEFEVGL